MRYFDTHAHYDDIKFEIDFPGGTEEALSASRKAGVERIICAGTRPETNSSTLRLADNYDFIFAAVGIHPSDTRFFGSENDFELLTETEKLLSHPKVVAVGEIGLDYHYEGTDRERQKFFFDSQMKIAAKHSLPVIIHDREAHGDSFETVRRHPDVSGVFHYFSGSAEMSKQLVKLGYCISFGGTVTFKNAKEVKEVAAIVPDHMILIETDAPYLAPAPHRGEINISAYLPLVVEALVEIRGTSPESIAELTYENAARVFKIQ
ncbi:MAG: TatD family hydrolase [Clostridia bacterium]|nr:TatD family hydrolase [Clostridia bacterium]